MTSTSLITPEGFRIAVYTFADGQDPPIVLHHGFSASFESEWVSTGIAAGLRPLGRRIIGIDALGHGRSDAPHEARFYGEARMADDLSRLLDRLGIESADLVGYSMGAIVAALAASRDTRWRRVVLGGVGEAVPLLGGVDTRALDNHTLAAALRADDASGFPAPAQGFRAGIDQRGADRFALAAQADVVHATPIALDRIRVPVLVLAGRADPLAIRPEKLAAAIPAARLALVDGDHGSARLAPDFVPAIRSFLSA